MVSTKSIFPILTLTPVVNLISLDSYVWLLAGQFIIRDVILSILLAIYTTGVVVGLAS